MKEKGAFELLDVSGDAGIRAYGKDLKEAFTNIAIGMYSLITELSRVNEKKEIEVKVNAPSIDSLVVSWLNELIYHFDTDGFIGKTISIRKLTDKEIEAIIKGEEFDPEIHERNILIKAATYHKLKVEKTGNGWEIDVIFDI
jgi:SHS2 domain-containing protein